VLVTGASGFLGGRLAQILVQQGERVTILARPTSDLRHLSAFIGGPLRVVTGTLTDSASLLEAVRDATIVFHCAAASTDWARMSVYTECNVRGTQTLLDAARRSTHLRRFVHVSTTDVYGYPSIPCAETGALKDAGLPYNRTKILAEKAVWREAQQSGLPVTVVRPATIYGPRGKAFVSDIAALLRKRQMISIDGGRATAGLLYVDDAVDAMIAAARSPAAEGRAYNLADGSGTTWKEYVSALAGKLGCKLPWIDLPFRTTIRIAHIMEAPFRYLAMPGRPLLTRHAVFLLGRHQEFPTHKACAELDFAPKVSVNEGIARSVDWLKSASSQF
jgi:nucleoside-diphosphate-sugar epimerase